jgi:hypothetical protein
MNIKIRAINYTSIIVGSLHSLYFTFEPISSLPMALYKRNRSQVFLEEAQRTTLEVHERCRI